MATSHLQSAFSSRRDLGSFEGLRISLAKGNPSSPCGVVIRKQPFRNLVVKAATALAPKFTIFKPLGDRVLVKIKSVEEKTPSGILLPNTVQTKPQGGEVVAVGEGKTIGKAQVAPIVQPGAKIVYSKYAGTEVKFNGADHLIVKEDDIIGLLETDDVKDLKPLNDRVLIKVAEAEEKTAGGILLTENAKEKPSIGMVLAVGPGSYDEEGNRKPVGVSSGSTVLYAKYAGNDFKSSDGSQYMTLRLSDVIAVLP